VEQHAGPAGRRRLQAATNPTTITHHGRRTLTAKTNLLQTNDPDALDLAQYLTQQYSTPATHVRSPWTT
jgi:hypothetical protein